MVRTNTLLSFALTVLAFTCAGLGCGYAFQGSGSVLPPEVKRIYIPDVVNRSSDPYVAALLTEALKERFERFGVVQVVSDANEADALLLVKIQQLRSTSKSSVAAGDVAQELNITVTLSGELKQKNGIILWKNPALLLTKSFGNTTASVVANSAQFAGSRLGSGDLSGLNQREVSRSQERLALEQISEEVSKTIYDEAVSPDF
jgi:outer membrane lipopolysaccharide assembly protein LptE/RlpB